MICACGRGWVPLPDSSEVASHPFCLFNFLKLTEHFTMLRIQDTRNDTGNQTFAILQTP